MQWAWLSSHKGPGAQEASVSQEEDHKGPAQRENRVGGETGQMWRATLHDWQVPFFHKFFLSS